MIRRYGVLHPKGGEDGHDIGRVRRNFLSTPAGIIRWET